MPFSNTNSTSSQNWTSIYEKIIKPTVEKSGEFECERSKATRGNIIKDIMNALNESDLVIADMTDHNPNVCYELGVRHGLKVGTILLAQKREFLNIFDLHNYGSHVYNWKTPSGKKKMVEKIEELIEDFINNPQKIDSPVQDFLQNKPSNFGILGFARMINPETGEPVKPMAPSTNPAKDAVHDYLLHYNDKNDEKKLRGKEYWKTFWEIFRDYISHPEAKFDGDLGVLDRKHVEIIEIVHIGKDHEH